MTSVELKIDSRPASEGIERLKGSLESAAKAADTAQAATEKLVEELIDTAQVSKTTATNLEEVAQASRRTAERQRDAASKITTTTDAAAKASSAYKDTTGRLVEMDRKLVSAGNSAQVMGQKISESAQGGIEDLKRIALQAAAVAGAFVGVRASVEAFSGFERTLAQVGSVAGATEGELRQLEAAAREAGASTEFSARQAGEGLLLLARAGFTSQQAIQALPGVLNLAIADAVELGEAADIAGSALNIFGLQAAELNRIADVLVQTSNKSNTGVRQLGEALSYVGPIAKVTGLSIEETGALVGVLGNAGIQASRAGTALSNILRGLASISGPAAETLRRLGLSQRDVSLESNTLVEVLRKLRDAQIGAFDAEQLFGAYGQAAALALSANVEKVVELTAANRASEGVADAAAKAVGDNLTGSYRNLQSAIEAAQIEIVGGINPALRGLTDTATEAVRGVFNLGDTLEETGTGARVLATGLAVLTGVGGFVGLVSGAKGANIALTALTATIKANPYTAAASAVLTLAGAYATWRGSISQVDQAVIGNVALLESLKDVTAALPRQIANFNSSLASDGQDGAQQQLQTVIQLLDIVKTRAEQAGTAVNLDNLAKLTGGGDLERFLLEQERLAESRLIGALSGPIRSENFDAFQAALADIGAQVETIAESNFDRKVDELKSAASLLRSAEENFDRQPNAGNLERLEERKERFRLASQELASEIVSGVRLVALDSEAFSAAVEVVKGQLRESFNAAPENGQAQGAGLPRGASIGEELDEETKKRDKLRQELSAYLSAQQLELDLLNLSERDRAIATAQIEAMAKAMGLGTQAAIAIGAANGLFARQLFDARDDLSAYNEALARQAQLQDEQDNARLRGKRALAENLVTVQQEIDLLKLGNRERFIELELLRARQQFDGAPLDEQDQAELERLRKALGELADGDAAARAAQNLSRSFGQAFADIIQQAESANDILRGLFSNLGNQLISGFAAQGFQAFFTGAGSPIAGAFASAAGNANGNAFSNGSASPLPNWTMAKAFGMGGVFSGPTFLQGAQGLNLFGEAGLELAAPAVRNARGQVAISIADNVRAIAQAMQPNVTVINNFSGGAGGPRSSNGVGGLGLSERQMVNNALRRAAI
jgi:TP901 family phage tail tape measure protein